MENQYADADALLAVLLDKNIVVKLYGKEWTLVNDVPPSLVIRVRREMENPSHLPTYEDDVELLKVLLKDPAEADELVAMNLGTTAMQVLLRIAWQTLVMGVSPADTIELMMKEAEARKAGVDESLGKVSAGDESPTQ